jgi:hypothetical protein
MKAFAGTPERESSTFPRVARRHGYPLIIPGRLRKQMFMRDAVTVKLVLSILTIYRVIRIPPILKLSTITDAFSGKSPELPLFEIKEVIRTLRAHLRFVILKDGQLEPSITSAPNSKIAILGAPIDAYAFKESPELLEAYAVVSKTTSSSLYQLLLQEIENIPNLIVSMTEEIRVAILANCKLGSLAEKIEAAGKVRVFAMTDVWTQSLLRPLHDALLRVLSQIPMDGTYDQLAPLRRLYDRGCSVFYSFDLTAATDRLPIRLQVQILQELTNSEFAEA